MDIYEYLPQLIVAYDGDDEFANLIHVKKANQNSAYYCPCCGGIVKPRAIESTKEQSHYYHLSGKCTKESQLHFFCKNWLFEPGSKFYVNGKLFEVKALDIERKWITKFGDYIPDVTVYTTSGEVIYFEMFFSNRKTEDNYFCKWSELGHSVVEINIKEYLFKTDQNIIPTFSYLFHDGQCYSKPYIKRDLYATTIGKIKRELTRQEALDYKSRIEKLDWFWQKIINNASKNEIIACICSMTYEDMISCYAIIKKKQCMSCIKNDVIKAINSKVINLVRNLLNLPLDDNVFFDLEHIRGRTYEAGIRLKIQSKHIIYDKFYLHCKCNRRNFNLSVGYPKIIFKKSIFTTEEIDVRPSKITELEDIFVRTVQYKNQLIAYEDELSAFENKGYKVRFNNNIYTVLEATEDGNYEPVLENYYMLSLDSKLLLKEVNRIVKEKQDKKFIETYINSEKAQALVSDLQNYKDIGAKVYVVYRKYPDPGIYIMLYLYGGNIYNSIFNANEKDFLDALSSLKIEIDTFFDKYKTIIELVSKINSCKTKFWKAELFFDYNKKLFLEIDQTYIDPNTWHMTHEKIEVDNLDLSNEGTLHKILASKMKLVMKNMEKYGYRVMEVRH